jgi:hypothetical protein
MYLILPLELSSAKPMLEARVSLEMSFFRKNMAEHTIFNADLLIGSSHDD